MRTPPPVLPPSGEQPEYRTTWFDRVGPDAGYQLKAASYGLMVFGITTGAVFFIVAGKGGLSRFAVMMLFVGAALLGALVTYMSLAFAGGAGAVVKAATLPSGASTPYEESYSYQESMVMRGDVTGALESYEAVISEQPAAVKVRLKAAELYVERRVDVRRAAALFREVRDLPGVTARDAVYASSRLADLYDGPLDEPGRALVELRRIVELYPGTAVAAHARDALPRLKARLAAQQSPPGAG